MAETSEMKPVEIARACIGVAESESPGNEWRSVGIARKHLEALLAEHEQALAAVGGARYVTYDRGPWQGALEVKVGEHKLKVMFERDEPLANLSPFLSDSLISLLPDDIAARYKPGA